MGSNGWTGGQYSLVRFVSGLLLTVHFVRLLLEQEALLTVAALGGAAASLLLAVGWLDRLAALLLIAIGLSLLRMTPEGTVSLFPDAVVGLALHALLPPAPFGSWAARGRTDPSGGWRMPAGIHAAAWLLLGVGYALLGWSRLTGEAATPARMALAVLELAFLPLAAPARLRPWLWLGMLALHAGHAPPAIPILHIFAFDPAWIAPRGKGRTERVFYDGTCGLCHATVRQVLSEDRSGSAFRFAPLHGGTFLGTLPASARATLPDSLVVVTEEGRLLVRAAAVRHILARLGGIWRGLAAAARLLPGVLQDRLYDLVAGMRRRLFAPPAAACPVLPDAMRDRFDG